MSRCTGWPLRPSADLAQLFNLLDVALAAAVEAVAGLHACLTAPGGVVTGTHVRALERLTRRLDAARLTAIAVVDTAGIAAGSGAASTGAWLAGATRADAAAAARQVRLAQALDAALPATRDALAAGDLSTEHAQVIARTIKALPDDVTPVERDRIEQSLVAKAKVMDPARRRRAARRALDAIERPREDVDAHHDQTLREEEDRAHAKTRLVLHDNGDGTTTGHFTVPTLAAQILRKIIQQMTAPRRAHTSTSSASSAGQANGTGWAHAHGQAFTELLEHLPTDHLTDKVAATVVVTLDLDQLRAGLGAAGLDTGEEISAAHVRRLACQAGIIPAVLGTRSVPLDLGRSRRLFSQTQRLALATRYDTCAADGCNRPYAWTELHHRHPWARGGTTDLAHAVPACRYHHQLLHDPRYQHTITTDMSGKKTITYEQRC